MKYIIQLLGLVMLSVTSSFAMATAMCSTTDIKLDFVQLAYDPVDPAPAALFDVGAGNGISTSDCVLLLGNDQPLPSGHNIGEYQDGLLNGEVKDSNSPPSLKPYNTLFDPFYDSATPETPLASNGSEGYNSELLFIDPLKDLQDLDDTDGNDDKTDPGWIYLGKDEGDGFGVGEDPVQVGKDLLGGVTISDALVDITFTCAVGSFGDGCTMGAWSIEPAFDIATTLEELLGTGFFDQLAFVIKTGNVCHPSEVEEDDVGGKKDCIDELEGPQFAIYNFDFAAIFEGMLGSEAAATAALQFPYNLGGTFDVSNTFHGADISHISVWARDPSSDITTTTISEPNAKLLLVLALFMIFIRYKRKHGIL